LHRRMGMICTSRGCAVSVNPRTNSFRDLALRVAEVSAFKGVKVKTPRSIAYAAEVAGRRLRICSPTLIDPVKIGASGMTPKR